MLLAYTFMLDFYVFRNNRNQKSSFIFTALLCKQDFFFPPMQFVSFLYIYIHGILLVSRALDKTVTSSTYNQSHKTCAGLEKKISISKNSDISRRLIFTIRLGIFCVHHRVSAGTKRSVSEHQRMGCLH